MIHRVLGVVDTQVGRLSSNGRSWHIYWRQEVPGSSHDRVRHLDPSHPQRSTWRRRNLWYWMAANYISEEQSKMFNVAISFCLFFSECQVSSEPKTSLLFQLHIISEFLELNKKWLSRKIDWQRLVQTGHRETMTFARRWDFALVISAIHTQSSLRVHY